MSDISDEMASHTPNGGFSANDYNTLATQVELARIVLLKSSFEVAPDLIGNRNQWRLSYGREVEACVHDASNDVVAGTYSYFMMAKFGRRTALKCSAEYAVFYDAPENPNADMLIALCKQIGLFAAYPYFRAIVARMAADAGVQLPPLPMIASKAHIPNRKS